MVVAVVEQPLQEHLALATHQVLVEPVQQQVLQDHH
tara:strand:- start:239 stop:346 length:108 start_codon:yes stop_codon:yes gene_type:complete